ncbi:MAG: T9SS type A sorting domain-containing protein [Fibrobacter sp.]|nr:T9SS type A sorting domain-containing protein [Fibrobacter sp.]
MEMGSSLYQEFKKNAKDIRINILSITGKLLLRQDKIITGKTQVDVSKMINGVYVVEI